MSGPWLLIDTSAPRAAVGVVTGGEVRSEVRLDEPRHHAEALPAALDRVLEEAGVAIADLEGIGAGRGPGSFVGVRVALATAKGLALAAGKPLLGISSLSALAGAEGVPEGEGLCVLDARRGEVYARRVQKAPGRIEPLEAPEALVPEEAARRAAGAAFVVGNALGLLGALPGVAAQIEVAGPPVAGLWQALVPRLQAGAGDELAGLIPEYCRPPDAKLPPPR